LPARISGVGFPDIHKKRRCESFARFVGKFQGADHEIASICASIGIIAAKPRIWARDFLVLKATRTKFPTHEKTKNRKLDYPKIIFHHPVSENRRAKREAKRR